MKYQILYSTNYYDGPLEGLVLYEGKKYWFRTFVYGGIGVTDFYMDKDWPDNEDMDPDQWQWCYLTRMYQVLELSWYEFLKHRLDYWIWVNVVRRLDEFNGTLYVARLWHKVFQRKKKYFNWLNKQKVIGAFSMDEYWRE